MAQKVEFTSGYKFVEGGRTTAVLDQNGKLSIPDSGTGSLEVWDSWKDYVKEKLEDKPSTGAEEEKLDQIGIAFGVWEPIFDDTEAPVASKSKSNEENQMATAVKTVAKKATVKAAAPAKKAVVAKKAAAPKAEKVYGPCICGCGGQTTGNFCPGHDARVHGWQKKIERGEMKFSECAPSAQKYMKDHGTKQGAKQVA